MPQILRLNIACSSYDEVVRNCIAWAGDGRSHGVAFAPVHVVMEAWDQPEYCAGLNSLDMVNPDGMPVVWALRLLGNKAATRVYGPDATLRLLEAAQQHQIPIGFYGGSETALRLLVQRVQRQFPAIRISYAFSPPFRELSAEEDAEIVRNLNTSGARLVFIGLGCPSQEQWILDHRDRVPAVLLAVGAAFDFLAGTKPQAPRWMMRSGLEWLFRVATEPRRLSGRYLRHNPRFIALFACQWLRSRFSRVSSEAV
jgi:N-acetylglucosaminyldiphosphoundecaprenol N-acetyl-beta-D-mannosaminyltransferase